MRKASCKLYLDANILYLLLQIMRREKEHKYKLEVSQLSCVF